MFGIDAKQILFLNYDGPKSISMHTIFRCDLLDLKSLLSRKASRLTKAGIEQEALLLVKDKIGRGG